MSSSLIKEVKNPLIKFISLPPEIPFASIAEKLGHLDANELSAEIIEVDQHRLEVLMIMNSGNKNSNYPQAYFDSVMKQTTTHLMWPIPWKVNAPYTKPPYLRVVGTNECIQKARQIISPTLGIHSARVIMKFDIPHDAHSFLIGARGSSIKSIKEKACIKHIHFPNYRLLPHENTNEVTMYGSLSSVETARHLLRISAPQIISFITEIKGNRKRVLEEMIPIIKTYETSYDVQIILYPRVKSNALLFLIKGTENAIENMKFVAKELLRYTIKWNVYNKDVQMRLQIAPQHHLAMQDHIQQIMENTNTVIKFPNLEDPHLKPRKKTFVTISGTVDNVYNAKQQLVGNLPVSLVFVYQNKSIESLFALIVELNEIFNVLITLESIDKTIFIATVLGTEKNIDNMYKCRQKLLKKRNEYVTPNIPANYFPIQEEVDNFTESKINHEINGLNYNSSLELASSSVDLTENSIEVPRDDSINNIMLSEKDVEQYELPSSNIANSLDIKKNVEDQLNTSNQNEISEEISLPTSPRKNFAPEVRSCVFVPSTPYYINQNASSYTKGLSVPEYFLTNNEKQEGENLKTDHANKWLSINNFMLYNRTTIPKTDEPPPGFEHFKPKLNFLVRYFDERSPVPATNPQSVKDLASPLPQRIRKVYQSNFTSEISINKATQPPLQKCQSVYKFNGSLAPGDERRLALRFKENA